MSPEATAGLYATFVAGDLALVAMLAVEIVGDYFRRRKKLRSMRLGMKPTFRDQKSRGTRVGVGALGGPSRAYGEGSVQRRSRARRLVAHEAKTAELEQEQLRRRPQPRGFERPEATAVLKG